MTRLLAVCGLVSGLLLGLGWWILMGCRRTRPCSKRVWKNGEFYYCVGYLPHDEHDLRRTTIASPY